MLTVGVDDLKRSLEFYRDGMGLATQGIVGTEFENGAAVFFDLEGGMKLAMFKRADLAIDSGVRVTPPSVTEFSIGHHVRTREEVDRVMSQAAAAGAHMVQPARDTFWGGYAGYFRDPDGHLWEIMWNPAWLPSD